MTNSSDDILKADSAQNEQPSSWLHFWLPRLAVAMVVPVLLLALTEGALRVFHVGYSAPFRLGLSRFGEQLADARRREQ